MSIRAVYRVPLCLLLQACLSCGDSEAPERGPIDYTGKYYVTIGPQPRFTMDIVHTGSEVTFLIEGTGFQIEGTGTIIGNTMSLEAEGPGAGAVTMLASFAAAGCSFSGTWEYVGAQPSQGTVTGTQLPWVTYDVETQGIPRLTTSDCIDLSLIRAVSRFRGGYGHDYSDDFESCRCMKHYFLPRDSVDMSTIRLISPVAGTVIGITDEWDDPETWQGQAIGIRPDGHEAFFIIIYEVDPAAELAVGDAVATGQVLGTSEKVSGSVSDIAVGLNTPAGYRLLSYFDVMTDSVFETYQARGLTHREDAVITRAERDADPLTCQGEEFAGPGRLENWIALD